MKNVYAVVAFLSVCLAQLPRAASEEDPFESDIDAGPKGRIDRLVMKRLADLGVEQSKVCSDGVFVRRVYLDVTGTLPGAEEAKRFIDDRDPEKRQKVIDALLESDDYVDYWTMKWCDLLRVKSEFPINLWPNAVQAYYRWIRSCVKQNVPYDRFVREQLTSSGSNFRKPQVNFFRAAQSKEPLAIAQIAALSFMGAQTDDWPKEPWSGLPAFFSLIEFKATGEWKEEIVQFDLEGAASEELRQLIQNAQLPDGTVVKIAPDEDPRIVFANWLITAENPWFTRCAANRVWYWLLGRGIVQPPNNIGPDNPPSNAELLAFLQQLVESGYDVKHLIRLILNSTTYQRSHILPTDDSQGPENFACYGIRRLEAEVLIDVLCQISGTREQYWSLIPEPFTYMPEDQRAVALADASISSPFLEKFGRATRDSGLETDRSNRTTAAQRLHMLNSSHVRRMIEGGPKMQPLIHWNRLKSEEAVTELYLTILSRYPTAEERQSVRDYSENSSARSNVLRDVAWALINGPEFVFRH